MKRSNAIGVGVVVAVVLGVVAMFPAAGEVPASAGTMKVAEGNNAFALDLYSKLKAKDGNLFFSPYSISTALAMTYGGARGDTERQMAQVLHFDLSQAELHPAFADLAKQVVAAGKSGGCRLSVANALWGQKGYKFLPDFVKLTKRHYSAPLQQVDFAASRQAAKTINDWVEEETNHKITNLVPPNVLNDLTRLVLTNAIYFKGTWVNRFKERQTRERDFTLVTGDKVKVPMMEQDTEFAYADVGNCQALAMPYTGGRLSMLILLPKEVANLGQVESQLTVPTLTEWMGKLRSAEVSVIMPKFKMTCEFSLGETLTALGMKDAFSLPPADFSGIDGRRDLFISAVLHKAFVDVNEEGTEAAAATAVIMTWSAKNIEIFRADHPFIFLIRDDKTGSILFIGRVMNPKE